MIYDDPGDVFLPIVFDILPDHIHAHGMSYQHDFVHVQSLEKFTQVSRHSCKICAVLRFVGITVTPLVIREHAEFFCKYGYVLFVEKTIASSAMDKYDALRVFWPSVLVVDPAVIFSDKIRHLCFLLLH